MREVARSFSVNAAYEKFVQMCGGAYEMRCFLKILYGDGLPLDGLAKQANLPFLLSSGMNEEICTDFHLLSLESRIWPFVLVLLKRSGRFFFYTYFFCCCCGAGSTI